MQALTERYDHVCRHSEPIGLLELADISSHSSTILYAYFFSCNTFCDNVFLCLYQLEMSWYTWYIYKSFKDIWDLKLNTSVELDHIVIDMN